MRKETGNPNTRMGSEYFLGVGQDVFQICGRNNAQRHLTINPAECQVINLAAERRNVGALSRVQLNRQNIFPLPIYVRSQIEREWRVTAFVFTQTLAIYPDGRGGHGAFEVDEDAL